VKSPANRTLWAEEDLNENVCLVVFVFIALRRSYQRAQSRNTRFAECSPFFDRKRFLEKAARVAKCMGIFVAKKAKCFTTLVMKNALSRLN
jgi:hypothetical protein